MNRIAVDIAMARVARPPDLLYSLGLGSCVGVAIYDPAVRIGGLIHVLLPTVQGFETGGHVRTKFADSGIRDLVDEMQRYGAVRSRMRAKIAGGAMMFGVRSAQQGDSIGSRNVESCRVTLRQLGIELVAQDTGGTKGRTITFNLETGKLTIKMIDQAERVI